jgi:hypothetical protein
MSELRTLLLLGTDAAGLLAPSVPAFRDLLRRPVASVPEALRRAAEQLGGGSCAGPGAPDASALLSLLDLDREHRKGHNRVFLAEARRALVAQGVLADREAEPEARREAERLLSCLARGDALVCLGPEERLDWALPRASGLDWSAARGYHVGFRKVRDGRGWRDPAARRASGVRVLKLRGSLGWIHCSRCRALFSAGPGGSVPGEMGEPHPCVHGDDLRERLVTGPGMRGRPLSILGRIRARAAEALARAERLVLIGEFPDLSDPFLHWVFRRAALDRSKAPRVVAAGPEAGRQGGRLRRWFGAPEEKRDFEGLDELVQHLGRPGTLF